MLTDAELAALVAMAGADGRRGRVLCSTGRDMDEGDHCAEEGGGGGGAGRVGWEVGGSFNIDTEDGIMARVFQAFALATGVMQAHSGKRRGYERRIISSPPLCGPTLSPQTDAASTKRPSPS